MKKIILILLYSALFLLIFLAVTGRIGKSSNNDPVFDSIDVPVVSPIDIAASPWLGDEPVSTKDVSFAVIGDFGDPSPSPADYVANQVNSWPIDAVVTTGDNNYPNGAYEDFEANTYSHYGKFIDLGVFFPTLGNHDRGYPDSNSYSDDNLPSSQYFTYLPGNRRYYSVVLGNGLVKIIVLSTDRRESDLALQEQWLWEELQSSEVYKFVFTHEPPYSSCLGKDSPSTRYPFKEWGATAVFSGHCHLYERLEVDGLTYIVNGAGGGGQVDSITGLLGESRFQSQSRGANLIQATSTEAIISFVDASGNTLDTITIQAGSQQAR